jgi:hypothetical protein
MMRMLEDPPAPLSFLLLDGFLPASAPPRRLSTTDPTTATAGAKSMGILFTVLQYGSGAEAVRKQRKYMLQTTNASRTARERSGLPVALATNVPLDGGAAAWGFDRILGIGSSWLGVRTGDNVWRDRLAAIAMSPFELTLSLDSSVTVCAGRALRLAMRYEHSVRRFDLAVNFEASPFVLTNTTAQHGDDDAMRRTATKGGSLFGSVQHFPRALEEVLPHNFAMVTHKGPGVHSPSALPPSHRRPRTAALAPPPSHRRRRCCRRRCCRRRCCRPRCCRRRSGTPHKIHACICVRVRARVRVLPGCPRRSGGSASALGSAACSRA